MKTVGLIIFIIILFFLGMVCLVYPEKVQEIAIRSVSHGYLTENSPLKSFVRSNRYLIIVRSVGFIAILCFCFLSLVFFRNKY